MTWQFEIRAASERRLFSRILQLLEVQGVFIHEFTAQADDSKAAIRVLISSPDDKAYRIHTLLGRLQNVHTVTYAVVQEALITQILATSHSS